MNLLWGLALTTHETEEGGGVDVALLTTLACVEPFGLDHPLFRSVDRKISGNQKVLGSREKHLRPTLGKGRPRTGA